MAPVESMTAIEMSREYPSSKPHVSKHNRNLSTHDNQQHDANEQKTIGVVESPEPNGGEDEEEVHKDGGECNGSPNNNKEPGMVFRGSDFSRNMGSKNNSENCSSSYLNPISYHHTEKLGVPWFSEHIPHYESPSWKILFPLWLESLFLDCILENHNNTPGQEEDQYQRAENGKPVHPGAFHNQISIPSGLPSHITFHKFDFVTV
nr:hypothetical protein Iba_scaffold38118CG0010 [Ipomoea batatas]GMD85421.1 hypothetical protein Iba_chr14aCG24190 [Ipomoea batatas]